MASLARFLSSPNAATKSTRGPGKQTLVPHPLRGPGGLASLAEKRVETAYDARERAASGHNDATLSSGRSFAEIPLFQSSPERVLQPKLEVGQPGDPLEQEADRVADQVLRASHSTSASDAPEEGRGSPAMTAGVMLSRACAACDKAEENLLGVQRKAEPSLPQGMAAAPSIVQEALRSGAGRPLDARTRAFFEPRFGADFSAVRVHTGAKASESARAVGALAYTVGHDIVFSADRYAPGQLAGQRLLAHELAHVVQQSRAHGAPLVRRKGGAAVQVLGKGDIGVTVTPVDLMDNTYQQPVRPKLIATLPKGTAVKVDDVVGPSYHVVLVADLELGGKVIPKDTPGYVIEKRSLAPANAGASQASPAGDGADKGAPPTPAPLAPKAPAESAPAAPPADETALVSAIGEAIVDQRFAFIFTELDLRDMAPMLRVLDRLSTDEIARLVSNCHAPNTDGRFVARLKAALATIQIGKSEGADVETVASGVQAIAQPTQTVAIVSYLKAHNANPSAAALLQRLAPPAPQGGSSTAPAAKEPERFYWIDPEENTKGPPTVPNANVRQDPRYVDNKATALAWSVQMGHYLILFGEDDIGLALDASLIDMSLLGPLSVSDTVYPTYDTAIANIGASPYAYCLTTRGTTIIPTKFSPYSTPRIMEMLADLRKKIAEYAQEMVDLFTVQAFSIGGAIVLQIVVPAGMNAAINKYDQKYRAAPPRQIRLPSEEPPVAPPKTPAAPEEPLAAGKSSAAPSEASESPAEEAVGPAKPAAAGGERAEASAAPGSPKPAVDPARAAAREYVRRAISRDEALARYVKEKGKIDGELLRALEPERRAALEARSKELEDWFVGRFYGDSESELPPAARPDRPPTGKAPETAPGDAQAQALKKYTRERTMLDRQLMHMLEPETRTQLEAYSEQLERQLAEEYYGAPKTAPSGTPEQAAEKATQAAAGKRDLDRALAQEDALVRYANERTTLVRELMRKLEPEVRADLEAYSEELETEFGESYYGEPKAEPRGTPEERPSKSARAAAGKQYVQREIERSNVLQKYVKELTTLDRELLRALDPELRAQLEAYSKELDQAFEKEFYGP